jgi:hypothetical protein
LDANPQTPTAIVTTKATITIITLEQVYDHLDKGLDAIEDGKSVCDCFIGCGT